MVQLRGGEGTFAPLSVGDNLRAALLGADLRRPEMLERRDEVLAVFPALAERLADPARDLSGGQRQMLALAMVLQHRPELLLIDELSLGLAPIVVQELLGALAQLREQGRTMLVVEQSVSVALNLADRAMFLENGRVVFEGRSEELLQRGRPAARGLPGRAGGGHRADAGGDGRIVIEVMDWGVSQQDLLIGGVTGLTYAALAAGFVLVYRASGILNFAHADVGALCAATFVLMLAGYGLNWWMAFAVAIVGGFIVGGAIELTIIRRLSQSSRLVLLIATIGVGQLLVLARINLPPVLRPGPIPPPFNLSWQVTDDLRILGRDLIVLIAVPVMVGVLGLVLHKTRFGTGGPGLSRQSRHGPHFRNPDAAHLHGPVGNRRFPLRRHGGVHRSAGGRQRRTDRNRRPGPTAAAAGAGGQSPGPDALAAHDAGGRVSGSASAKRSCATTWSQPTAQSSTCSCSAPYWWQSCSRRALAGTRPAGRCRRNSGRCRCSSGIYRSCATWAPSA